MQECNNPTHFRTPEPHFILPRCAAASLQARYDLKVRATKYRQGLEGRRRRKKKTTRLTLIARARTIIVAHYSTTHWQLKREVKGGGWVRPICKRPKHFLEAGWRRTISSLPPFLLTPTRTLNIEPQSCWPTRPLPRCGYYLPWRAHFHGRLFTFIHKKRWCDGHSSSVTFKETKSPR